jgi:DNA-binding response OmpR family regulator
VSRAELQLSCGASVPYYNVRFIQNDTRMLQANSHESGIDRMPQVLLVEDSSTDAERMVSYLQQAGIMVLKVTNGDEARTKLKLHQLDLVVLDVMLPGQSGFELCYELKTNVATEHIPIVLCSTKQTNADKLWGGLLGADAYLTKPINKYKLLNTIAELIRFEGLNHWNGKNIKPGTEC